MNKRILFLLAAAILILAALFTWQYARVHRQRPQTFSGDRAYLDVVHLVSLGPRTPGSLAHEDAINYFRSELQKSNWAVDVQVAEVNGNLIKNVIARRSDMPPEVILGAHYDSRLMADRDPDPEKQSQPVPGANDGASGAALLLELGRVLPASSVPVWLVFFDAEDQGSIPGWQDWSIGARAFVDAFTLKPRAVVILDMIGDKNLEIYQEKQSSQRLINEIWSVAHELGYQKYFLNERKYTITDDHVPFLDVGIPAVDIIDMEYRYWHTSHDTADRVSPVSLGVVGTTIQVWLGQQRR